MRAAFRDMRRIAIALFGLETLALVFLALGLILVSTMSNAQSSRADYAAACVEAVEAIPDFSCAAGAEVPVTVNGQIITASNFQPQMNCDRPALLDNGAESDGQCVPGSRILNHSSPTAQISVMCRQKHLRPDGSMLFDEIDVIAHNPASGATCWFQAKAPNKDLPLDGRQVTSPTAVTYPDIWESPEEVANDGCGTCHDNDPFMYSPFVGQVWREVPTNPFGPYWHVGGQFGFDQWPLEVFDLRDNTCLGCHRMGTTQTSGALTDWMTGLVAPKGADPAAQGFPLSHAMPPDHGLTHVAWDVFHRASVADLRACHANPSLDMCAVTSLKE